MEKKLPEFKPLPELGNVANNYMSAFNVGMNIYEALAYLQGYLQITYNSVEDMIKELDNLDDYAKDIFNQWLEDGTLNELIATNPQWALKVNKTGDVMSGDLQFQENTGVYGTLHSGTKANMISHSYTGTDDYTQIGDDNAQTVIHSENRPVWYDGTQNKNLLVEEDLRPKENLLINADFKSGIINQRGKTAYTGKTATSTYTIDRWFISKSPSAVLSVNNGYISVSLPTLHSAGQFIDYEPVGEMTVAIKLKDSDVKVITVDNWTDYGSNKAYRFEGIDTGVSIRLVKYEVDDNWCLFIYNESGITKTFNIEYIKLEKGSVYTGMPVWDEILETYKCICKQFMLGNGWVNQYPARSDTSMHRIFIALPFKPEKNPTVVILGESNEGNVVLSGNENNTQQLSISTINVAKISGNGVYLEMPLGTTQQIGYGSAVFSVPVMLDFNEY